MPCVEYLNSLLSKDKLYKTALRCSKMFPAEIFISPNNEFNLMLYYKAGDENGWEVYALYMSWLVEASNFSSSFSISLVGSWKLDLVILFHSLSTRKNIHWKRLSISRTATANTVRWLWRKCAESLYVHVQRRIKLLPITQK